MPPTTARGKKAELEGELERVYRTLREWLISARLRPGEFLSEFDLAAQCRTSRTPVREACGRLAQDKWLTRIPRKGYLVAPISVRDIVDLYEFRRLLECFSAEKVARSASREQIQELADLVRGENDPDADLREILSGNQAFHLRLAQSLPATSGWWTNCGYRSDMSSVWIHCARRRFRAGSRIPIFCWPSNPIAHWRRIKPWRYTLMLPAIR